MSNQLIVGKNWMARRNRPGHHWTWTPTLPTSTQSTHQTFVDPIDDLHVDANFANSIALKSNITPHRPHDAQTCQSSHPGCSIWWSCPWHVDPSATPNCWSRAVHMVDSSGSWCTYQWMKLHEKWCEFVKFLRTTKKLQMACGMYLIGTPSNNHRSRRSATSF